MIEFEQVLRELWSYADTTRALPHFAPAALAVVIGVSLLLALLVRSVVVVLLCGILWTGAVMSIIAPDKLSNIFALSAAAAAILVPFHNLGILRRTRKLTNEIATLSAKVMRLETAEERRLLHQVRGDHSTPPITTDPAAPPARFPLAPRTGPGAQGEVRRSDQQ
jgi:hypothetical protein